MTTAGISGNEETHVHVSFCLVGFGSVLCAGLLVIRPGLNSVYLSHSPLFLWPLYVKSYKCSCDIFIDMYFLFVQTTKIFGSGPRTVQEHMVDHFYK